MENILKVSALTSCESKPATTEITTTKMSTETTTYE